MLSPAKLAHVVLKTYNVEEMRTYYCDLLGAHVVFEQIPAVSFITYDNEHHRLGFVGLNGASEDNNPGTPGLGHLAFAFLNIRTLLKKYEELRAKGLTPSISINHGPTISFYYADPDKNNVEFYIDRLTLEESFEFMETEVFKKNYMGVEFDPDVLLQKMHDGASDEELIFYDETARPNLEEMSIRHTRLMNLK